MVLLRNFSSKQWRNQALLEWILVSPASIPLPRIVVCLSVLDTSFHCFDVVLCVWRRCASGSPEENDHLRLNPHSIVLLHGTGKDQPSGQLKDLKLFNTTLSESTVRSKCRCELNSYAEPCTTTVLKAPSAALTMYSTVRNRDAPGVGFGRGRLNSPQAY